MSAAMTLRSRTWESLSISSSVTPSAKYSSLGSGLKLSSGRTATLSFGLGVLCAGLSGASPRPEMRKTSMGVTTFLSSGTPSDSNRCSTLLTTL